MKLPNDTSGMSPKELLALADKIKAEAMMIPRKSPPIGHLPTKAQLVVANKIKTYVQALDASGYPEEGVVSHFGVYVSTPYVSLFIGHQAKKLMLILEKRDRWKEDSHGQSHEVGYTKQSWDELIQTISEILDRNVLDRWNGHENATHASVVFNCKAPDALIQAVDNYYKVKNSFERDATATANYKKFEEWLNSRLKAVRKEIK